MDPELDAIKQQRMAQMMAGGGGNVPSSAEEMQQQEEARRSAEDQRLSMLAAVMTPDARERLSRIAIVKPDKARGIENMILGAAQRGQLGEKVTEERLVGMLEQISEKEATKPKMTIQRRRPNLFDDDD